MLRKCIVVIKKELYVLFCRLDDTYLLVEKPTILYEIIYRECNRKTITGNSSELKSIRSHNRLRRKEFRKYENLGFQGANKSINERMIVCLV